MATDVEKTVKDVIEEFIDKVDTSIRRVVEKIQGTWDYMRFIWSHDSYREWDYVYLYDLMMFKLDRMEKQLRKDSYVVSAESTANKIKEVIHYYTLYREVEDKYMPDYKEEYSRKHVVTIYAMEQAAWDKMHDILKKEAQKWWS